MITFALRLMKKEELVRSEPELDDVDAEDTALEVDIIRLFLRKTQRWR